MTLDPAADPDRFDPDRFDPAQDVGPLDPALDPDRFQEPLTLPGLLGPGAYEEEREGLEWLYGLLGVFLFLGLVTAAIYWL
jgi:hypothetical protein